MNERPAFLDRFLIGIIVLSAALWMVRSHWESVDGPNAAGKIRLHEKVLANEARDPYQYKLWVISEAFEWLRTRVDPALVERTHADDPLTLIFFANILFSILFFVLMHHYWLRSYVDPPVAALGALLLAALSLTLFRGYQHHPYEFWGLAGFCLLLRGIEREWSFITLSVLGLITGLLWEKHALLAPLWGLYRLLKKDAFGPTFAKGIVFLASCLAVPLLVRWHLDSHLAAGVVRGAVDGDTPLDVQKWDLVAWYQGAYVLPFLLIFLARWRAVPTWVRLLWLYLPVLVGLYLWQHYIIHETRSFFALAPVFTATLCCWFASLHGRATAVPPSPQGAVDPHPDPTPAPREAQAPEADEAAAPAPTPPRPSAPATLAPFTLATEAEDAPGESDPAEAQPEADDAHPLAPLATRLTRLLEVVTQVADPQYQRRKWIRGEGTSYASFSDAACLFFDDLDGPALGGDFGRSLGLSEATRRAFEAFALVYDGFLRLVQGRPDLDEETVDDETLLALPEWQGVIRAARAALRAAQTDAALGPLVNQVHLDDEDDTTDAASDVTAT